MCLCVRASEIRFHVKLLMGCERKGGQREREMRHAFIIITVLIIIIIIFIIWLKMRIYCHHKARARGTSLYSRCLYLTGR